MIYKKIEGNSSLTILYLALGGVMFLLLISYLFYEICEVITMIVSSIFEGTLYDPRGMGFYVACILLTLYFYGSVELKKSVERERGGKGGLIGNIALFSPGLIGFSWCSFSALTRGHRYSDPSSLVQFDWFVNTLVGYGEKFISVGAMLMLGLTFLSLLENVDEGHVGKIKKDNRRMHPIRPRTNSEPEPPKPSEPPKQQTPIETFYHIYGQTTVNGVCFEMITVDAFLARLLECGESCNADMDKETGLFVEKHWQRIPRSTRKSYCFVFPKWLDFNGEIICLADDGGVADRVSYNKYNPYYGYTRSYCFLRRIED